MLTNAILTTLSVFVLTSAAAAASDAVLAPTRDGGVCVGLAWVQLATGEQAYIERGPDFDVFRFQGSSGPTDHWWGVYSGFAAQVRGNGAQLFRRDGVVVNRASEDGKFRGYVAEKGRQQNHFFGSVFKGTAADHSFFDRIDFGPKGQARCAERR